MAPKALAGKSQSSAQIASRKPQTKSAARKTGVKQPLPVTERLKRLFASLCAQIDGGHFSNAIKTCDKVLRLEPNDKDALQTKLFLLLQTEQYEQALDLVGNDSASQHAFERAYSLYRLHRESEAAEAIRVIKERKNIEQDRGVLHLEAQLNYRGGSYQTAFDVYTQLLDTAEPQTEEHSDILTNLHASQRQLDFMNKDYLRALDLLPANLTTSLESTPPPAQPSSSLAAALVSSAAAGGSSAHDLPSGKVKKVRVSRVPVGVTPGVTPPPDPERWLKKSERSTFAQGGRRRKGGAGGGGATQGSTSENVSAGNTSGHQGKTSGGGKGKKKK